MKGQEGHHNIKILLLGDCEDPQQTSRQSGQQFPDSSVCSSVITQPVKTVVVQCLLWLWTGDVKFERQGHIPVREGLMKDAFELLYLKCRVQCFWSLSGYLCIFFKSVSCNSPNFLEVILNCLSSPLSVAHGDILTQRKDKRSAGQGIILCGP